MLEIIIRTFPRNVNTVCDLAWGYKYGYMAFPPSDSTGLSEIFVDVPKNEFIAFIDEITKTGISYNIKEVA